MKISYVTLYKRSDIHQWSGLGYFISKALEDQGAELDYVEILDSGRSIPLRIKKLFYRARGQQYYHEREASVGKEYARQVKNLVKPDTDIIFSPGSLAIAFLDAGKPKVFYADACFAGMIGFYNDYSRLARETIDQGNAAEQEALATSALAIYASDWAAKTALSNYTVDPAKVKVVPFGANIQCDRDRQKIGEIVARRSKDECHLLFMGVDWVRKGGDLAVAVAQALNDRGLKTVLHVVGVPDVRLNRLPSFVVNHGFVSKSSLEGRNKIDALMSTSHFLILPTRAECYGLVFCEACSFGLPSLATAVGGIPTIIRDDVNGKMFPLSGAADEYAAYILAVFRNKTEYERLAHSSFSEYEQRLNWKTAGAKVMALLKEIPLKR